MKTKVIFAKLDKTSPTYLQDAAEFIASGGVRVKAQFRREVYASRVIIPEADETFLNSVLNRN